jgi:hypothetical protein
MPDTKYNLLPLVADLTSRRLLNNLNSITPRAALVFVYDDTLEGEIRIVRQTGLVTPPLVRINLPTFDSGVIIALTDGQSIVYANATNLALVGTGDVGDPRIVFNLDVSSVALDTALAAEGGQFITAYFEARLRVTAVDGAIIQDQVTLREQCQIYKTAIPNP